MVAVRLWRNIAQAREQVQEDTERQDFKLSAYAADTPIFYFALFACFAAILIFVIPTGPAAEVDRRDLQP